MAADMPTLREIKTLILATGGELENMTEALADEVAPADHACASKIRRLGAELAAAIRSTALDVTSKPPD